MINKYQVLEFADTLDAEELDLLLQQLLITYESKRGGSDEVELQEYIRREPLKNADEIFYWENKQQHKRVTILDGETKHPIPDPPPPPALRVLKGDKVVGVNSCACGTWKNLWLCKPEDCKCGFYKVGKNDS